jgi:hypothetical protein
MHLHLLEIGTANRPALVEARGLMPTTIGSFNVAVLKAMNGAACLMRSPPD